MQQSVGLLHVHRRSLPSWVLMCWEHQALEPAGRAPHTAFIQGSGEPAGPRRLMRRLPVGRKAQLPLCPVFCFCVDTEEPDFVFTCVVVLFFSTVRLSKCSVPPPDMRTCTRLLTGHRPSGPCHGSGLCPSSPSAVPVMCACPPRTLSL